MNDQGNLPFEALSKTVTTAYTTLVTMSMGLKSRGCVMNLELHNSGSTTISDTKIQLQDHKNGEWYDYKGATDFDSTTDTNMLFNTTLGPQEVTAGNRSHTHMRINAAYGMRVQSKVGSGTTTVNVRGTIKSA